MTGPAALLVALFLTLGPDGSALHPQLAAAKSSVPAAPLLDVAPRLWVVFHDRPGLQMALYAPPGAAAQLGLDTDLASSVEARLVAGLLGAEARLLPDLDIPRLLLYRPYYQNVGADGRRTQVPVDRMALDVAEYYFNALWEAWLDLELAEHPELANALELRAHDLMQSVPEASRGGAYLTAVSDFASHSFSVAGELRRSMARARAAGRDLCPAVDLPNTLYGLWTKIFTDHGYRGGYFSKSATGGPREWHASQESLEREDKELVQRRVWDGFWTGHVRQDFAISCP